MFDYNSLYINLVMSRKTHQNGFMIRP